MKFEESLSPYGFRLYQKCFYRAINGVAQSVALKTHSYGFEVYFHMRPLFLGETNLFAEEFPINIFRESFQRYTHWDKFCPFTGRKWTEKDLEIIVSEMLSIVITYVIPMFERVTDWKSGDNEIKKHNEGYFEKIQATAQYVPGLGQDEYYKLIKLGEYEKAIDIAQERILTNTDWNGIFSKELERLFKFDAGYFEDLFAKNEIRACEYLSKPSKYDKNK